MAAEPMTPSARGCMILSMLALTGFIVLSVVSIFTLAFQTCNVAVDAKLLWPLKGYSQWEATFEYAGQEYTRTVNDPDYQVPDGATDAQVCFHNSPSGEDPKQDRFNYMGGYDVYYYSKSFERGVKIALATFGSVTMGVPLLFLLVKSLLVKPLHGLQESVKDFCCRHRQTQPADILPVCFPEKPLQSLTPPA